jgi:hypothetical protein
MIWSVDGPISYPPGVKSEVVFGHVTASPLKLYTIKDKGAITQLKNILHGIMEIVRVCEPQIVAFGGLQKIQRFRLENTSLVVFCRSPTSFPTFLLVTLKSSHILLI